jgi:ATP-dependent Lhr-like helicase
MDRYDPALLDMLCLTGEVGWARLSPAATSVGGATPIAIFLRDHAAQWLALRDAGDAALSSTAARVLATLEARGAMFFKDLAAATNVDDEAAGAAIGELVAAGRLTADGFAGLRAIVDPRSKAGSVAGRGQGGRSGRWSAIARVENDTGQPADAAIDTQARALLARYGVVFRRLAAREAIAIPWRSLARAYRRLEARGEIRGGRFVTGMSGEQFALPDAVERLREVRRTAKDGRLITISAADPLNLAGILDSGDRVRTITAHRIVYRDGIALAALEGDYMRPLRVIEPDAAADVASALVGRRMPAVTSGYVGA